MGTGGHIVYLVELGVLVGLAIQTMQDSCYFTHSQGHATDIWNARDLGTWGPGEVVKLMLVSAQGSVGFQGSASARLAWLPFAI
jgi:hypothetical protein